MVKTLVPDLVVYSPAAVQFPAVGQESVVATSETRPARARSLMSCALRQVPLTWAAVKAR
jgi:hypothetical protein